jgi:hypothetical protein
VYLLRASLTASLASVREARFQMPENPQNASEGIPLGGPVGAGARGFQTCRERTLSSYPFIIYAFTLIRPGDRAFHRRAGRLGTSPRLYHFLSRR